jgi:hypothetical protein
VGAEVHGLQNEQRPPKSFEFFPWTQRMDKAHKLIIVYYNGQKPQKNFTFVSWTTKIGKNFKTKMYVTTDNTPQNG